MEAAAFVLLQLHETNKHAIGHKETSKRLCLKQNLVFVRTAGEKTGLDCAFNILRPATWQGLTSAALCNCLYLLNSIFSCYFCDKNQ